MLTIHVPEKELFNERDASFHTVKGGEIHLEHSLISLSKWESKWKKPYLDNKELTREELFDYIYCMVVDKNVDRETINNLDTKTVMEILDYIKDPHTATTIHDRRPGRSRKSEVITAEVIRYWMIYYRIPESYEKWHLNNLMTLIRICGIKGGTNDQEMSLNSIFAQNNAIRAKRRAKK